MGSARSSFPAPRQWTGTTRTYTGPARLEVASGRARGLRYPVEDEVVLGRTRDANVVLGDHDVSRRHARVTRLELGGYLLEDLDSKNGTRVNGRRVQRVLLQFGDRIQLGPNTELLFVPHDPLEDHALQRQRFETVGRLGTGIAHDLNNMLAAVSASADYLTKLDQNQKLGNPEIQECIRDIRTAAEQATELTRGLLGFVRGQPAAQVTLDVSALCREVVRLIGHTFERSIRIEHSIESRLFVVGDRAGLHQVLMNLCLNARDAMPNGGQLHVSASLKSNAGSEDIVELTVRDTGLGMDAETKARIFEPFFTTKRASAGSGIGLSTVKEVMSAHRGTVQVESEPGEGTTFVLGFPALAVPESRERVTARPSMKSGCNRRGVILLVDDERVVARSVARVLRHAGHDVLEANDGQSAVAMLGEPNLRVDLILLDLEMPGLSGEETLQLVHEVQPAVSVLLMSGHHDTARIAAAQAAGAVGFLSKPCTSDRILSEVDRVLGLPQLSTLSLDDPTEWTRQVSRIKE